jgi:hypothetical protein
MCTASILLTGCGAIKEYVPYPVERVIRETITVRDTVVDVVLKQIHDSVTVNLAKDTTSYLENRYAYTYAAVTGGNLIHSLGTQKESVTIETKYIEKIRTDSIPYAVEVPGKEVIVRKPTVWQTLSHIGTGMLIAAILGLFIIKK